MAKAEWNGVTIAECDDTVIVENNHYFPRSAVRGDVLRESDTHTVCPWKGTASYYSIEVDGQTNPDAAWYYPRAEGGGGADHRPDRVLARRRGHRLTQAPRGCG